MDDNNNLASQAIQAALNGNWNEAIKLNTEILKQDKKDVEALLRLARSYEELGKVRLAKTAFNKVLRIDKFNQIAKRSLVKFKDYKISSKDKKRTNQQIQCNLFLEEPGKTKSVLLVSLAPPKTVLSLNVAQQLKLSVGKMSISVKDKQNRYLGRLPDDLSQRLIKLINWGYEYVIVVKAIEKNNLQVFIKEIKRSKKYDYIPSFSTTSEAYHSFIPKGIIEEEA